MIIFFKILRYFSSKWWPAWIKPSPAVTLPFSLENLVATFLTIPPIISNNLGVDNKIEINNETTASFKLVSASSTWPLTSATWPCKAPKLEAKAESISLSKLFNSVSSAPSASNNFWLFK